MPTGYHDNSNNPTNNFVLHRTATDAGRGIPAVGKLVYRTDTSSPEFCTSTSPDPTLNGGGTWTRVLNEATDGASVFDSGTFTPSITGVGSFAADPDLGTSPGLTGSWQIAYGWAYCNVRIRWGASPDIGAASSIYRFNLPTDLTDHIATTQECVGQATLVDQNTGETLTASVDLGYSGSPGAILTTRYSGGAAGNSVAGGNPWTWAEDDLIVFSFIVPVTS
jgi:hypothetical protein